MMRCCTYLHERNSVERQQQTSHTLPCRLQVNPAASKRVLSKWPCQLQVNEYSKVRAGWRTGGFWSAFSTIPSLVLVDGLLMAIDVHLQQVNEWVSKFYSHFWFTCSRHGSVLGKRPKRHRLDSLQGRFDPLGRPNLLFHLLNSHLANSKKTYNSQWCDF